MIQPGQILNTVDEFLEARRLQSEGVKFEIRRRNNQYGMFTPGYCAFNDAVDAVYRRAPDPVIEIKPGQVIRTEAEFRRAEEMQAQGVKFQYRCNTPACCPEWKTPRNGKVSFGRLPSCRERYRRAPATKTVPLGPEDVPPGSVIRPQNGGRFVGCHSVGWSGIAGVGPTSIRIHARNIRTDETVTETLTYEELRTHLIKRPGGDWEPCEKVIEVEE